jgi:hypothetical protein
VWHEGGLWVSPKGNIAVSSYLHRDATLAARKDEDTTGSGNGGRYQPTLYPGRAFSKNSAIVNVWDKHGKLIHEDAVPGLMVVHGLSMDNDDNLYVLASANRLLGGKMIPAMRATGTLIKFKPGKGKLIGSDQEGQAPIKLQPAQRPKRPPDLETVRGGAGTTWVEGAEWFYGGLGWSGDTAYGSVKCSCGNMRATLDYFNRCFAPEVNHCSVAVLDSNGNLILRVGRYGNVDDGLPLIKEGGPARPRPVGGDEVALFYAPYVATHSDRRLFIADPGNERIVSVKLGYHAEESVALKAVTDAGE